MILSTKEGSGGIAQTAITHLVTKALLSHLKAASCLRLLLTQSLSSSADMNLAEKNVN